MSVKVGDTAPAFSTQDQEGNPVSLADFAGKRVVLWFYPKADTPGCTREGCNYRDLAERYADQGTQILGVSYDTPGANKAFHTKYRFSYPLLSDTDHSIAKAYGAYVDGQPYPNRNTYVISGEGTIEGVHEGVNPKTHPRALLDSLG
ncbi:MAG: peroxiredoxin [Planctomycetota bacterium]